MIILLNFVPNLDKAIKNIIIIKSRLKISPVDVGSDLSVSDTAMHLHMVITSNLINKSSWSHILCESQLRSNIKRDYNLVGSRRSPDNDL